MWWAAAIAVSETIRMVSIHHGALIWTKAWIHMQTLLRANMLAAQMASGGVHAGQPIGSAGSAITHFRDDTEDVANLVDGMVDISGGLVFTVIAGFVLGAADARAAAVLVIPLLGVGIATRVLDTRIKEYRAADRQATEGVTGLLGDVMAAATTVKVNDATEPMLRRLAVLVERRRYTAVRDRVLEEGVQAFSQGAADIGLGLVLLVSAGAIASGSFDLGTLALFTAYLGWLSFLPRMVGRVLARRKQAGVAFDRMRALVADQEAENTVRRQRLPIDPSDQRVRPDVVRPERVALERLEVDGLTVSYGGRPVVDDVSFGVARGEFVVITGPVGAGKSTLLRALLGLAWQAEVHGSVRWNGAEIDDRAAFLVPPNAAFLSQVPQLISDSVADNVGLGPVTDADLARAFELSAIATDIAEMPDGRCDADRSARSAALGRTASAVGHGAGARPRAGTRRARRPVERARRRDRGAAVDQPGRRGHDGDRRVASGGRVRPRRPGPSPRRRPSGRVSRRRSWRAGGRGGRRCGFGWRSAGRRRTDENRCG